MAEAAEATSKTRQVVEAARTRAEARRRQEEEQAQEQARIKEESVLADEPLKERAGELVETVVQYRNGTIDGSVDLEAMGDVKGNGDDAANYDDSDPAKALGVPVYVHGLGRTGGDDTEVAPQFERKHSARTAAELDRGRQALEGRVPVENRRSTSGSSRMAVTDTDSDKDGSEGARKVEEARKRAAEKKAGEDK